MFASLRRTSSPAPPDRSARPTGTDAPHSPVPHVLFQSRTERRHPGQRQTLLHSLRVLPQSTHALTTHRSTLFFADAISPTARAFCVTRHPSFTRNASSSSGIAFLRTTAPPPWRLPGRDLSTTARDCVRIAQSRRPRIKQHLTSKHVAVSVVNSSSRHMNRHQLRRSVVQRHATRDDVRCALLFEQRSKRHSPSHHASGAMRRSFRRRPRRRRQHQQVGLFVSAPSTTISLLQRPGRQQRLGGGEVHPECANVGSACVRRRPSHRAGGHGDARGYPNQRRARSAGGSVRRGAWRNEQ